MTSKTLLLAAAAVLSLGVGSAFAESDGSGNTYGDVQYWNSGAGRASQMAPSQQITGHAAGDATSRGIPATSFFSDGAGG